MLGALHLAASIALSFLVIGATNFISQGLCLTGMSAAERQALQRSVESAVTILTWAPVLAGAIQLLFGAATGLSLAVRRDRD